MDQTPLFLTKYALARILKELAKSLGLSETMSDAVAQIHLQTSHSAVHWSDFLSRNCAECALDPQTCDFLSPARVPPGQSVESIRTGVALSIETGRLKSCPLKNQRLPPASKDDE